MRVFITGISGFVGAGLAQSLRAHGHDVCGSSTREVPAGSDSIVQLRLGEPFDAALFRETDVLIHAAHDLKKGARKRNVTGTLAIADAARNIGVQQQLFISSYSAHDAAVTEYGLTKREIEQWFLANDFPVVRPGLVIGRGGMYARMSEIVRKHTFVPVISPHAMVPVIAIGDLGTAIAQLLHQRRKDVVRLYLEQRVTMDELMREIRRASGSRALLVPVPYVAALTAAALLERVRGGAEFGADNVRALQANQQVNEPSDLLAYVPAPATLQQMIDAAR